jgi:hypothetical protein
MFCVGVTVSKENDEKKSDSGQTNVSQELNFLKCRRPDDYDSFGEYVAMELRSLSSEMHNKMLKREIRQSIARIAELDDLNSLATCSTKITEPLSPDQ